MKKTWKLIFKKISYVNDLQKCMLISYGTVIDIIYLLIKNLDGVPRFLTMDLYIF